jgi:NADPH-dependent curcumin reductase CurA
MAGARNRQVILAERPLGIPEARHFELRETPMPEAGDGEILVRNHFLSVDPAMRGWVNEAANYSQPVAIGAVMRSFAAGEVVRSNHADYAPGDLVCGMFGWTEHAVSDGANVVFRHDMAEVPLSTSLGVLGVNGITAYFALLDIGAPKAGETVVVSTAAGSVGSAVGQIAKIKGCRAVGLTGSGEKVRQCVTEFGYDVAIDYRAGDLDRALDQACPDGIDVYFDNTAGAISDAVYRHLNIAARCIVCGTASEASWDPWPEGPRIERHLLVKRARIEGFLLFDYAARYQEARTQLGEWIAAGKLTYREDILDGLEQAPGAIARLYAGENKGKLLIRLD